MTLDKVQLLDDSGVTPGSYTLTNLTVGADGRLTAASSGSLNATGVTPGSYNLSSITVGADGRLTAASTPTSINLPSIANPGDGDITSAGGSDGIFTISNSSNDTPMLLGATTGGVMGPKVVLDPRPSNCYTWPFVLPGSSPNGYFYVKGNLLLGTQFDDSGELSSTGGSDGNFGIFNGAETLGDPINTTSRSISFWTKTYSNNNTECRFTINQYGSTSLQSLGYLGQLIGVGGGALGSSDMVVDGGTDGQFVIFNNSGAAARMISLAINNESLNGPDALLRCYRDGGTGARIVDCPLPGTTFDVNGTKLFRIEHPIDSSKDLVHVSIEGPRADLIYRGNVKLINGGATVDLDEEYGLIPGTWKSLCRNPQVWITSVDGWEPCKGSVSDQILTIYSKDSNSKETVSWLVVAERKDSAMYGPSSDEEGRPILEPNRRPPNNPHPYPDFPNSPVQQTQSNSSESSSEDDAAKLP
jgi:hypothetical protein